LEAGGTAIDAGVASVLCVGIWNPQSSGIGGGGFMMLKTPTGVQSVNCREQAPANATESMFMWVACHISLVLICVLCNSATHCV
jgi:gamma-glutamyltranspeptidase / glutathione hydrolase / leukotriene-C4 hydrolase